MTDIMAGRSVAVDTFSPQSPFMHASKVIPGSQADLEQKAEAEKDYQNKQAQQAYLDAIRASAQGFGGAGNSQTRQPSGYGSYGAGGGTNQTLG